MILFVYFYLNMSTQGPTNKVLYWCGLKCHWKIILSPKTVYSYKPTQMYNLLVNHLLNQCVLVSIDTLVQRNLRVELPFVIKACTCILSGISLSMCCSDITNMYICNSFKKTHYFQFSSSLPTLNSLTSDSQRTQRRLHLHRKRKL